MNYSQFIHGKTIGGHNYQIVAMTPDLVGRETELESIAQSYRFWGQQPPETNPIAVGVFRHQDNLLLAQAMSATHSSGRAAVDDKGRPFSQHRYIFLPADSLNDVAGRLWLLLNWIIEETRGIPVFDRIDRNLRTIPAPRFSSHRANPSDEIDKLNRVLTLRDKAGEAVVLSALAALVNGKRVVMDAADTDGVFSEDLLEAALLLLPAICRTEVSIAAGALDEGVCTQASLMVKTNGTPDGPLGAGVIWAKRASNQFFGATDQGALRSDYTNLLQPILAQPDALPVLLRILDGVNDMPPASYTSPWQALNNGWLATRLIPALPNPEERAKYWRAALRGLTPEAWRKILPAVIDDIGLEIAWDELRRDVKRDPAEFASLVPVLWQNFSEAYISYALQKELPSDLALAEALLAHSALTELDRMHQSDLRNVVLTTVTRLAKNEPARARSLVEAVTNTGPFTTLADQLALKEATLPPQPTQSELYAFFSTELAPILPQLTLADIETSRFYTRLVDLNQSCADLIRQIITHPHRNITQLPLLASQTGMNAAHARRFYAACIDIWQPKYTDVVPLLADLVTRWIADSPPDERPPLTALTIDMATWLRASAPANIAPLLVDNSDGNEVTDWQTLAQHLFDDPLAQVSMVDHVTIGQPVEHLCQQWLVVMADNREAKTNFEASYTWHTLQEDGPSWLAEAVGQLLGWQEASLSAMLPVIERIQSALTLPQSIIFQLLEALPRQGDDNLGMMLAACLPSLIEDDHADVETLPLWQMLNTQAPKVAQVYKSLAEGPQNVAIDLVNQRKLTAALTEAAEYGPALAQWLRACGKEDWIRGRVLETVIGLWVNQPDRVDAALLTDLVQPEVTRHYAIADWVTLAQICWQPAYQSLWPENGQPPLNNRQRTQVLNLAKSHIRGYQTVAQTDRLLIACQTWGLTDHDMADLVGHIPDTACNFRQVNTYLSMNGSINMANDHITQNLVSLAMRLRPTDDIERTQLKVFLTCLIQSQLQADDGISFLGNWFQITADQPLYEAATTDAALALAPDHFSLLVKRAQQLQRQNGGHLSQTLTAALDRYWQHEKQNLKRN